MTKALRTALLTLFLATLVMSQCPGDPDDAPNCDMCDTEDNTLCDDCADGFQFEHVLFTPDG